MTSASQITYGIGNFYNEAAAKAYAIYNDMSKTTISICPKGWKLPSSGANSGDFNILAGMLNNSTSNLKAYPNNFVQTGWVGGGGPYDTAPSRDHRAAYSANGYYHASNGLGLRLESTISYGFQAQDGYSIRCLLDN